ncbi:MAG: lipoyl protein ligase domain-containing protein, partial [Solirubrobacteraceae bacterium]
RRHGFEPLLRMAGGRVVAYHEGCLVLDEIVAARDAISSLHERFEQSAEVHASALRTLGVDALVGELAGEYCPGEFSVNARGAVKLAGSAQRIIRGAWLLATVFVVSDAAAVRAVLEDVQAALGVRWEPATVGAIADEADVSMAHVRRALLAEYEPLYRLVPAPLGEHELVAARAELERHLPAA